MSEISKTRRNRIGKTQRINCFLEWLKDHKKRNPIKPKKNQTFER